MALQEVQLVVPGSTTVVGGVKQGSGVTIAADGTLTATGGGGGDIPAGSIMYFGQASAPSGWTQNVTNNNFALRLVSGAGGGTGGSQGFTTAFASQTPSGTVSSSGSCTPQGSVSLSGLSVSGISVSGTVGSTTITTTTMPSHEHTYNNPVPGGLAYQAGSNATSVVGQLTQTTGGGGGGNQGHQHSFSGSASGGSVTGSASFSGSNTSVSVTSSFTGNAINLAVQYVDIISCTKS